jgi:hypothetical protein
MTKPSDVAASETSTAVAWWSVYPTVVLYQGNITPANFDSLAGRLPISSTIAPRGRTPCLVTAPQAMNIYTRAGVGNVRYYTDTIYVSLPDNTNVGVSRGGVQAWRTW